MSCIINKVDSVVDFLRSEEKKFKSLEFKLIVGPPKLFKFRFL